METERSFSCGDVVKCFRGRDEGFFAVMRTEGKFCYLADGRRRSAAPGRSSSDALSTASRAAKSRSMPAPSRMRSSASASPFEARMVKTTKPSDVVWRIMRGDFFSMRGTARNWRARIRLFGRVERHSKRID